MDQLSNLEYQAVNFLVNFQQIERGNSLRSLSARCLFNISPIGELRDFSNVPTEHLERMAQARKTSLFRMKRVLVMYECRHMYLCVGSVRYYQGQISQMINVVKKAAKELDQISKILTEERGCQVIRSSHFEMTVETMMNNFIANVRTSKQSSKVFSPLKKFSSINENWRQNPSATSSLRNPSTNKAYRDYIINRSKVLANEYRAYQENRRLRAANLNRGLCQNDNQGASDNSFDLATVDEALPAVPNCSGQGQQFRHVSQNDNQGASGNSFDLTSLGEALPTVLDSATRKRRLRLLEVLKRPFYRKQKLRSIEFLETRLKSLSHSLQALD